MKNAGYQKYQMAVFASAYGNFRYAKLYLTQDTAAFCLLILNGFFFMDPLASSLDGVNLQKKFTPSLYREMQSVESFLRLRHNDHRLNDLTTISISGQPQSEFRHNRALLLRYW